MLPDIKIRTLHVLLNSSATEETAVKSIATSILRSSQVRAIQHSFGAGIDLNVFRLSDYGIPYGYSTALVAADSFLECANPIAPRSRASIVSSMHYRARSAALLAGM